MIKSQPKPDHTTSTPKLKLLGHRELLQSRGGTADSKNDNQVDGPHSSW